MFNRLFAISALSVVLLIGCQVYRTCSCPASELQSFSRVDDATEMDGENRERALSLNDWAIRRAAFRDLADRLEFDLAHGRVTLREATDRLFYFCLQKYPERLEHLCQIEPGHNVRSSLARTLVREFAVAGPSEYPGVDLGSLQARLEREFCELAGSDEQATTVDISRTPGGPL